MTPVRWGMPAWFSGAAALALLVVGVLLVRPPRPVVLLTEPSPEARCGVVEGSVVPPKPLGPTHTRPDAKGACDGPGVAINGGCWIELVPKPAGPDGCGKWGWEHAGKCWNPVWESPRPPQSATP